MWILAFAIAAASAVGDEPGPAELVRLLGSADRAEREEAARTLEELGDAALPPLHAAEKAAAGAAREGAATLARRIEGRRLERPSLVAVDFDGQPLEEAIRTLAARSGHAIQLDAGGDAGLPRRPIVARAPSPVPFWEALDLVGRAGHVRHDPGAGAWNLDRSRVLHVADGEPPSWTLYRGAFRVHVVGMHRRRDRDLGGQPGREDSTRDALYVDLQVFAEPGRFLDFDGMPRVEAEDDRGHTLPPASAEADRPRRPYPGWNVPGALGVYQWKYPLGLPDPAATRLRRLRGTLPVLVSATRPDPLIISLDDSPGQSYRHGGTTLRFQPVGARGRQAQIELILTQDRGPGASRDDRPEGAFLHCISFEDRKGKPLSWVRNSDNAGAGGERRMMILVSEGERPIRLRFHDIIWSSAEIPFEFTDIPLP